MGCCPVQGNVSHPGFRGQLLSHGPPIITCVSPRESTPSSALGQDCSGKTRLGSRTVAALAEHDENVCGGCWSVMWSPEYPVKPRGGITHSHKKRVGTEAGGPTSLGKCCPSGGGRTFKTLPKPVT